MSSPIVIQMLLGNGQVGHKKTGKTLAERQKRRYDERRSLFDRLKNLPCHDCGVKYPTVCMDFDHREGTEKKFNVGDSIMWGINKILDEVAKCDLVCVNCHRLRSKVRDIGKSKPKDSTAKIRRKYHEKKQQFMRKFKDVPCTDCNLRYDPRCMEFDHIDRKLKKFTISMCITKKSKELHEEISKCEVVCGNCHRIRTWKRG